MTSFYTLPPFSVLDYYLMTKKRLECDPCKLFCKEVSLFKTANADWNDSSVCERSLGATFLWVDHRCFWSTPSVQPNWFHSKGWGGLTFFFFFPLEFIWFLSWVQPHENLANISEQASGRCLSYDFCWSRAVSSVCKLLLWLVHFFSFSIKGIYQSFWLQ